MDYTKYSRILQNGDTQNILIFIGILGRDIH